MLNKFRRCIVASLLSLLSFDACSEVVINGTRVIFDAKDKESIIQLKNNGKNPYLLQMWLDNGDPRSKPGEVKVPFIVNPPVIRIDPDKGQAVRVLAVNPSLPKDRESLFWFNMLEVPPKPTDMIKSGGNLLQMAFRTRIKLFYRPENLNISPAEAYKKIKINLSGNKITISNDTPYFITFNKLEIRDSKQSPVLAFVDVFTSRMVEPMGKIEFTLKYNTTKNLTGESLFYSVINDYGGESINVQVLGSNI